MQIQVNTDNHIRGSEELTGRVASVVEGALERFRRRITRVEVHLTDESSSAKFRENDKRCVMEARLGGLAPVSVTHEGATVDQAVEGAADKLERLLDRTLGRLGDAKGRPSFGGDSTT